MLILTRKIDQAIIIDGEIQVRVLAVNGERVKLGIAAPRSVTVLRDELCDAVRAENRAAGAARPAELRTLRERINAHHASDSGAVDSEATG